MRIGEETTTAVSALSTWVAFKCDLAKSAISSSNHLARLMRWGVDSLSEAGCIGRALATECSPMCHTGVLVVRSLLVDGSSRWHAPCCAMCRFVIVLHHRGRWLCAVVRSAVGCMDTRCSGVMRMGRCVACGPFCHWVFRREIALLVSRRNLSTVRWGGRKSRHRFTRMAVGAERRSVGFARVRTAVVTFPAENVAMV